jgi:hypothetical protein
MNRGPVGIAMDYRPLCFRQIHGSGPFGYPVIRAGMIGFIISTNAFQQA